MKHPKTKQDLKKITRHKKIDTSDMPKRDGKAVERAERELDKDETTEPRKMRQQTLPAEGMAPTVHKAVNEAAQELAEQKDRCKAAAQAKKMREADLIREMRKVGLTHYVDRGLNIEVILESPDRVKVKQYNHRDDEDLTT